MTICKFCMIDWSYDSFLPVMCGQLDERYWSRREGLQWNDAWTSASSPFRADFQPVNSGFHWPGLWGLHSIISGNIKPLDSSPSQIMPAKLHLLSEPNGIWTRRDAPEPDKKADACVMRSMKSSTCFNHHLQSGFGSNDTVSLTLPRGTTIKRFHKSYTPASNRLLEWNPSSLLAVASHYFSKAQSGSLRLRSTKLACYIIPIGVLLRLLPV